MLYQPRGGDRKKFSVIRIGKSFGFICLRSEVEEYSRTNIVWKNGSDIFFQFLDKILPYKQVVIAHSWPCSTMYLPTWCSSQSTQAQLRHFTIRLTCCCFFFIDEYNRYVLIFFIQNTNAIQNITQQNILWIYLLVNKI